MSVRKIILGCVGDDLSVNAIKVPANKYHSHADLNMDGIGFRVSQNEIFWWDEIPNKTIQDEVNAKLDKMGVPSPRKNRILSLIGLSHKTYEKRFLKSHGYPS